MLAVVSPTAMAPSARFSSGCLILALVLCAAFRSIDVGSDTSTYFSIVRDITDNFSSHSYLEPAYRYVVIISSYLSDEEFFPHLLLSACSLIPIFIALNLVYYRNTLCSYRYLSIFIYFCSYYMPYDLNGVRQGISQNLYLLSCVYLCLRHYKAGGSALVASLFFHSASLVALLPSSLFYFKHLKIGIRSFIFFILLALTLVLNLSDALGIFLSYASYNINSGISSGLISLVLKLVYSLHLLVSDAIS